MKTVSPRDAVAALRAGKRRHRSHGDSSRPRRQSGLPRVREIKGRDADKPIALLCASAEEAFGLAANVPPLAKELAELYWPALTLVLDLPSGGTIGVRVPAGNAVRDLLRPTKAHSTQQARTSPASLPQRRPMMWTRKCSSPST